MSYIDVLNKAEDQAVSYTHLDVSKRQVFVTHCASRSPCGNVD